jgi:hypothetical protein
LGTLLTLPGPRKPEVRVDALGSGFFCAQNAFDGKNEIMKNYLGKITLVSSGKHQMLTTV